MELLHYKAHWERHDEQYSSSVAMIIKWQFNFDWALLLAIVVGFGIFHLAAWLRKRN
jgi:hypothetical protein